MKVQLRDGRLATITSSNAQPAPWHLRGVIEGNASSQPDCWRRNGLWHESDRQTRNDIVKADPGDGVFREFSEIQPASPTQPA